MIALYIVLGVLALFIAVLLIRTAAFKPKADAQTIDETTVTFDRDKAVSNLQTLVRCKTISYRDGELEEEAEFQKLSAKNLSNG